MTQSGTAQRLTPRKRRLVAAMMTARSVAEAAELREEADGAGLSWRTMTRAKDQLGVVAKREKRDGKTRWYWALPTGV